MGGSIPKEKYIKTCSSYFPLFRRKMLHFTREKKNTLMVLNADHQRYKNYIWLQNIIITIAILTGCRTSFHYMGFKQ